MKTYTEIEKLAEGYRCPATNENEYCKHDIISAYNNGYTQCQKDMADNFLSLIEEYREKELPNRNIAYHYEAEISSGLNLLIEFIKNKQD
jgi:hypothetical protein